MGPCPHALYTHLVNDLSGVLSSWDYFDLFKEDLTPQPDASPSVAAALALLSSINKKFAYMKSDTADDVALMKFLESNRLCKDFCIDDSTLSERDSIMLGEFHKEVYDFFSGNFDYRILNFREIVKGCAVGPGASVGAEGDDFYHKFGLSRLTYTSSAVLSSYEVYCANFPLWKEADECRLNHVGGNRAVQGSSLSFVPKTNAVSRTICTEPLLNMFFQKGIGYVLEKRLKGRYAIDLSVQPQFNSELARLGSVSGRFATIDLSSASDSIALGMCKRFIPGDAMHFLEVFRSPSTSLPGGSVIPLHMVSSMGNAFTFPLQTMLFTAMVHAVYRTYDISPVYNRGGLAGNFAVFGDDIIVLTEMYEPLSRLLSLLGFRLNPSKCFVVGPFRESCGKDFWSGANIRGVYCRRLDTLQDKYSLINRLLVWASNHAIPLYSSVSYLLEFCDLILKVPPWENDNAGIKVPLCLVTRRRRDKNLSFLYQRFLPRVRKDSLVNLADKPLRHRRRKSGFRPENPPAVLLSALGGYLRDGCITYRLGDTVRYRTQVAVAPGWDYMNLSQSSFSAEGWRRWLAVYASSHLVTVS